MEPELLGLLGDGTIATALTVGWFKMSKLHASERKERDDAWQKALDKTVRRLQESLETVATAISKIDDRMRAADLKTAAVDGMLIASIVEDNPERAKKLAQALFASGPSATDG